MKPEKNFEDFLGMKAMEDYHGDKDHWESYFERFLEELQIDDMIKYADEYADTLKKYFNYQISVIKTVAYEGI